jgi:hypothetical protein
LNPSCAKQLTAAQAKTISASAAQSPTCR